MLRTRLSSASLQGTAISFLLLAVTRMAILFGKRVLLPLIGHGGLGLLLSKAPASWFSSSVRCSGSSWC